MTAHSSIPEAELSAMVLTGEAVPLALGVTVPLGESAPAAKAAALAEGLPAYAAIDRLSAAWVWGAVVEPPAVVQIAQRWSPALARPRREEEPFLDRRRTDWRDEEAIEHAGVHIFTPGRVLFDFLASDDEPDARLHLIAQGSARGTLAALDARPSSGLTSRVRRRLAEDLARLRAPRRDDF